MNDRLEQIYNDLQSRSNELPEGTLDSPSRGRGYFSFKFIPQNPIEDTFDSIDISLNRRIEVIETSLLKNGAEVFIRDLGYSLGQLPQYFSNVDELIQELNRLSKPKVNEEELPVMGEETPFNVTISSIEDDETKSDDEENDEENLNMAIEMSKMSFNDEMEIDEDYSFKKIYDNLINYFENKENRNNSKDSVNDFFKKFLDNEED